MRDANDILREDGTDALRQAFDSGLRVVEPAATADTTPITNGKGLIVHSRDFTANYVPPNYLIDGILQRRFIYSITAPTSGGKTAIALLLSAHVAEGLELAGREVEKGRVLYLAGENPDDHRGRWIGMASEMGFDTDTIDCHFIEGIFSIEKQFDQIAREVRELGGVQFVIVDTSAAYFQGTDENDNVQAGNHARMLRQLTGLPGGPCVLVACHPTKRASNSDLIPRGGGAFIAEVDGNLACRNADKIVELQAQGKFRGPEFSPISFELQEVTCEALRDAKGRMRCTVMAKPINETRRTELHHEARKDEDELLLYLMKGPKESIATIAETLGWLLAHGGPYKTRVVRGLDKLKHHGLVEKGRDGYCLTKNGKAEANKIIAASEAVS